VLSSTNSDAEAMLQVLMPVPLQAKAAFTVFTPLLFVMAELFVIRLP